MEKNSVSWKTVAIISGAFASFSIGSGFASGQEIMQFFCSWGGVWPFVIPFVLFLWIAGYSTCTLHLVREENFEKPSDAYEAYFGRTLGKILDVVSLIIIALVSLAMFAGAGATITQYTGLPEYIGAVGVGIMSLLVVWMGLNRISQVLGVAGIAIIAIVVFVGVYNLVAQQGSLADASENIKGYVEDGTFLQISVLGIKNPVLAGVIYGSSALLPGFPFLIGLAGRVKSGKEATVSGIFTGALFIVGVYLIIVTLLKNIDYIAANGTEIPILTAIENSLPFLTTLYVVVIIAGVLTTAIGLLWLVGRRFAEDKTMKQRIIVTVVAAVGVGTGSFIPFSTIVNFVYPLEGLGGLVIFIGIVAALAKRTKMKKESKTESSETAA